MSAAHERERERGRAEKMLDVPQRLLERVVKSHDLQVAATGTIRYLKQILASRTNRKRARRA